MKRPDSPQPLTLTEAIIPVASLILLVGLSYLLFGDAGAVGPNQVALVVAAMIAVFIGWRRGHSIESLGQAARDSVATGIGAIFILLAVGGLIGTWALSGTLVAMVYYGLQLLNPDYFYVTACAVSAIVATNIISADQYIAIVLPGRMFKSAFARRGLAPVVLSRAVGDTATPTSALIPWNSCGAYMAATLGVATWSYAPYAVFSIVSPILTVAIAYAGIRMHRLPVTAE